MELNKKKTALMLLMQFLVSSLTLCFLSECSHSSSLCSFSFSVRHKQSHSLSSTLPPKSKRQPTASKGQNGLTQIEQSFLFTRRMYWSITSWDLDLIPTLGARSNYLAWRKHLSCVACSDFLFGAYARQLLGISFVFCINLPSNTVFFFLD